MQPCRKNTFTAQQGHGLGLHLPDIPWRALGVGKVAFVRVRKHDVAQFMEEGLYRESYDRADRDFSAALGVTLGVAVQVLERDALDFQRRKSSFFVPFGDGGRLVTG